MGVAVHVRFGYDLQATGRIRGDHQCFDPLTIEAGLATAEKLVRDRNAGVQPDRAAAVTGLWIVAPGEIERFTTSKFRPDNHLDMSQDSIVKVGGEARVIGQFSHIHHSKGSVGVTLT